MRQILKFISMILLFSSTIMASVSVIPPSVRISQGDAALLSLTYQFTESPTCISATSTSGTFATTDYVLGTVSSSVNVLLNSGLGTASETIAIPYSVLKLAEERGASSFTFKRQFTVTCGTGIITETATVYITLTTAAGADFTIRRVQLYFDNYRAETTVKRNSKVHAYANIAFSGSGLLRGYWEVDGRAYPPVIEHLSGVQNAILTFPDVPPLPTYTPGSHIVRFVITSPTQALATPKIIYYVTDEEELQTIPTIPANGASLKWNPLQNGSYYYIQMFGKDKEEAIFSAYTKDAHYQIPDFALRNMFRQAGTYYWEVNGFDAEGKLNGKSGRIPFTLP